jgi:hypothetical protein
MKFLWLVMILLSLNSVDEKNQWGSFSGPVQFESLQDGRMKLLADFTYTGVNGEKWLAPQGAVVDGASIPQAFRSVIGGRFEERYRRASVLHDVACDKKNRPWEQVHLAFYNAMRCGGVDEIKSKIMYAAVYHFGPRWGISDFLINFLTIRRISFFTPTRHDLNRKSPQEAKNDVERISKWIETDNPRLDEIEKADIKKIAK